jgi:2Fe-2S ferredoxin
MQRSAAVGVSFARQFGGTAPRRSIRRSFSVLSAKEKDIVSSRTFLLELGYEDDVTEGIIKTLSEPSAGVPTGAMTTMVKAMAGRWEVDEDAGLQTLAKAVREDLLKTAGKELVKFVVRVPSAGNLEIECEGYEGMSLQDVVENGGPLEDYIECACAGLCACSTCHVVVEKKWFDAMEQPEEAEMDMVELAFEPKPTSRLGCQIILKPELNGMVVNIPGGANNLFDHIPFK